MLRFFWSTLSLPSFYQWCSDICSVLSWPETVQVSIKQTPWLLTAPPFTQCPGLDNTLHVHTEKGTELSGGWQNRQSKIPFLQIVVLIFPAATRMITDNWGWTKPQKANILSEPCLSEVVDWSSTWRRNTCGHSKEFWSGYRPGKEGEGEGSHVPCISNPSTKLQPVSMGPSALTSELCDGQERTMLTAICHPWFVQPLWSRIALSFGSQVLLVKAENPSG